MWIKKKILKLEASASHLNKYIITIDHDAFNLKNTSGSFNVICARLMNLSYAQWLRFCRDIGDAELVGKDTLYPVPYFTLTKKSYELVDLVNSRANMVLWEREHPDWREHQKYMEGKQEAAENGINE